MRLLLAVLIALCAQAALAQGGLPGDNYMLRPWTAPDGVTAGWTQPAKHNESDGLALTPAGDVLAVASMFRATSEVRVIDLGARRGWRLVAADWRLDLFDPAFSSDGRRLALVVSAPHHRGLTEIWVVDREGGPVLHRVAADGRAYRYPTFSPDGRRLAYFRDVDPPRSLDAKGFPEFAYKTAYALFEYDLQTGVETQLANQAFGIPCGVRYRPADDGLFYCALHPLEWRLVHPELPRRWAARTPREDQESNFAYESRIGHAKTFFVRRGDEIPPLAEPFAPATGPTRGAMLIGARADGAALMVNAGPEPHIELYVAYLPGTPPQTVEVSLKAFGCSKRAASADGRIFAFEGDCTHPKRNDDYKSKPSSFFITRDGKLEIIPSRKIAFEPTVRIIAPPEGSYFATTPPTRYDWPRR